MSREMNVRERDTLHRALSEMGKDDIMNLIFHLITTRELDIIKILNSLSEQEHVSDKPYTWIDYANRLGGYKI